MRFVANGLRPPNRHVLIDTFVRGHWLYPLCLLMSQTPINRPLLHGQWFWQKSNRVIKSLVFYIQGQIES